MHFDGGFPDLFPGDIQVVFFVVLFWWEWAKKGGDAFMSTYPCHQCPQFIHP